MSTPRPRRLAAVALAVLVTGAPLLVSCGNLRSLPGPAGDLASAAGGCDELAAGNFGALSADAKTIGFLEASFAFQKLAIELEGDLIASCAELGDAIGADPAALKAVPNDGEGAKQVCGAASAKIHGILRAAAGGGLDVTIEEPDCFADVDAFNACWATCGTPVGPGELSASCKGGEIAGRCEGTCEGSCSVDAGAACRGSCSGSCAGSCDAGFRGTCGGTCDGACDGKTTRGACAGTCEGACDAQAAGSCTGTCSGTCSASCEVKGQADCKGRCEGGCKGTLEAPTCSGELQPPKVELACQANCSVKTLGDVTCEPARVVIEPRGKADAELTRLIDALAVSLPKIAAIQLGAARKLGEAGASVAAQGEGLVSAASGGSAKLLVCLEAAIEANLSAAASVDANVKASASVSGSATGKARAGG